MRPYTRRAVAAVVLLAAVGAVVLMTRAKSPAVKVDRRMAHEAICVLLVRDVLGYLKMDPGELVFLQVDDGEPSDGVLQRVQLVHPGIRPVSACRLKPPSGRVEDRVTGRRGTLIFVDPMRWMKDGSVEVEAGSCISLMGAGALIYTLALRAGEWRIVSKRGSWVS